MSLEALQDLARGALVVAMLVVILRAFYAAFESQWPEHYFGGSRSVDPVISQTLFRYVCFRFGPVLLAAIAAGAVAERSHLPRAPLVIAMVAVHAFTGTGVGLVQALRARPPKIALAGYRLMALSACAAAGATAIIVGDRADPYVPSGQEVAYACWIALAVFAVARVGRSLTARQPDDAELLARATREVSSDLAQQLMASPITYPEAAVAIAYVEHLNRPAWARKIERRLRPRNGTYGLMQMRSRTSLTDQESVDLFFERLPDYPKIAEDENGINVRPFFLHHNNDPEFADLAERFFWSLRSLDAI